MSFSFRPGLSFYALSIACAIAITIVFSLISAYIFKAKSPGEMVSSLGKSPLALAAGAFLISVTIVFTVSNLLFPKLCRWSAK